jgi:phosphomannomutase
VTTGTVGYQDEPAVSRDLAAEVRAWIARDPDPTTRAELEGLLRAGNGAGLHARFDRPLVFGTAGLRGALGAGPARMNRAVVRATSVGLARWVADRGDAARRAGIIVGYDARHGSATFAADTAEVAAAAGVRVRMLTRPLPTPITAFAVRHLEAAAGVMITASHNPATDNGYKAYAADGAQVIPPDDARIAALAAEAGPPADLELSPQQRRLVEHLDDATVLAAYAATVTRVLDPGGPRRLRIVYTPLHGVGGAVLPDLLVGAGFDPPVPVARQAEPDPDFPTVAFPNPEEHGALDLAFAEARRIAADVVLANDPDGDRLAVAFPDRGGDYRMLTGDELGSLLGDYLLTRTHGTDRLVATTIVSSSLLASLAAEAGVGYAETLTGFKWIARAAAAHPGRRLVFGYEEALGYAVTDAVADKDGLSAALVTAELAATEKAAGRTLADRLDDIAARLGVHVTSQVSLRRQDEGAIAEFAATTARLRAHPPRALAGLAVTDVVDYARPTVDLPPSDVVALRLGQTARVVVRPSGTEPKLKAYLEVVTEPPGRAGLDAARRLAQATLAALRRDVVAMLAEAD